METTELRMGFWLAVIMPRGTAMAVRVAEALMTKNIEMLFMCL